MNRLTIVTGPMLLIMSIFSVLRQTGRIDLNIEVPVLVITLGVLMLVAHMLPLGGSGRGASSSPKR
jgi:hypothetical protein